MNLALLAAIVAVLVAVAELTLRATGFSYVLYPEEIEFGRPEPVLLETGFVEDDDLFWVTKDYRQKLERLRRDRPQVIFLGNSTVAIECTLLEAPLDSCGAIRMWNILGAYGNLGVAGWSSYQGRRQLERDVAPLGPRVVTLYFGWNDHWIGFGIEDKNVARVKAVFSSRWSRLRLVQLATQATVAVGSRDTDYPNRVSRADFAANLRAMVRHARSRGIRPVLITAAASHVAGEEPKELTERWLRDLSELVPLHRSYVAAVREVAAAEGADLCDPEAELGALSRAELGRLFRADGIHLTAEGDRRLAEILYDCFERRGIWAQILGGPG